MSASTKSVSCVTGAASARVRWKLWWPVCEGIGAAHFLASITGDAFYEDWYRRIWDFTSDHLIDRTTGAFIPQLDAELEAFRQRVKEQNAARIIHTSRSSGGDGGLAGLGLFGVTAAVAIYRRRAS